MNGPSNKPGFQDERSKHHQCWSENQSGVCLDLLDTANTQLLGEWYVELRRFMQRNGIAMPHQPGCSGQSSWRQGATVPRLRREDFALKGMARNSG